MMRSARRRWLAAVPAMVLAAGCGGADGRVGARREPAGVRELAAAPAAARPDPLTGPDSARTRARIDSVFARFDRPGSPGCVVAVMRAGEIMFGRGYGAADLRTGERLSIRSAFDAASMTKQFLAFGIALLAAEGRLSLDDPVRKHLPELPDHGAAITLRHLVHHTSGLRDQDAVWLSGRRDLDPSTLTGLSFPPGTRHVYDDTGYMLLERVLERVSGQGVWEFQRTRIFGPLGMDSVGTPAPGRADVPRRVAPYAPRDGGGFRIAGSRDEGGFTITPGDLAKWDRNFYDGRVGGPEVLRMMMREGRLENGETVPYGMGLHTEPYRGLRRQWHGGLSGGYRAQLMRYPDQRTSVLVMCNVYQLAEPNGLAERVTDIVLADAIAAAEKPVPAAGPLPSAAEMERLAALYVDRDRQMLRPVRFTGGGLEVRQWITWLGTTPLGGGRYRVSGQPLTLVFRPNPDGSAGALEEHWDGTRTPAVLRAAPRIQPSAAELEAYAGRYASAELGTSWTLTREGGGLRVQPRHGSSRVALLRPAGRDVFSDHEYVLVLFRRDARGRVAGFDLATPRVQRLAFARRAE